ncbi:unnamed protein product [Candidula unifasciata]|uniref:Uncharacterized protein n=1 Tax=Candidula unifasciata TaxID=100452 RepID=A0A8S3ZL46_9EUPU|nr:unnamed protein product [Candidula unifasciata]
MFFKYNKITQSLSSATQDVAMGRPNTPEAFKVAVQESPEIVYDYKPLKVAEIQPSSHGESGVYLVPNNKRFKRLMSLQAQFLSADGKLVWQKFAADRTLYYLSAGLAAVGFIWSLYGLKRLASPPKNE